MTDERTKKEAIELAEDFTDWMGASWPMCGGINATVKLADMASKRFKTAERLAKIEALKEVRHNAERGYVLAYIEKRIAELKEAILGSPVKEGKTSPDAFDMALRVLAFNPSVPNATGKLADMIEQYAEDYCAEKLAIAVKALEKNIRKRYDWRWDS